MQQCTVDHCRILPRHRLTLTFDGFFSGGGENVVLMDLFLLDELMINNFEASNCITA